MLCIIGLHTSHQLIILKLTKPDDDIPVCVFSCFYIYDLKGKLCLLYGSKGKLCSLKGFKGNCVHFKVLREIVLTLGF